MALLVNVGGMRFSGTTMLDLMLGNRPDAFSCGEVAAYYRPYRKHHARYKCTCGEYPCSTWQPLLPGGCRGLHRRIADRLGVALVVDSSKDINWIVDANRWARDSGLTVFNLLCFKPPLSSAHSHWKRQWDLDRWRREFLQGYGRFYRVGLPVMTVDYDALVADPAGKLRDAMRRLGMEARPGQERFWEKPHHLLWGNNGPRAMLRSPDPAIRAEPFDPGFAPVVERLSASLEQDAPMRALMDRLRSDEVSSGEIPSPNPLPSRRILPAWYYAHALMGYWRRRFPLD